MDLQETDYLQLKTVYKASNHVITEDECVKPTCLVWCLRSGHTIAAFFCKLHDCQLMHTATACFCNTSHTQQMPWLLA